MADAPSILVIDVDRMTGDLIREISISLGFIPVRVLNSLDRVWAVTGEMKPDIIICDVGVKDPNAIGFIRKLRDPGESFNPLVAVIAMSSSADAECVFAARDAGANEFLAKPFTAKAIFQRLFEIVQRPRAFVVLSSYFGPDRRRANRPFQGTERRVAPALPTPGVRIVEENTPFTKAFRQKAQESSVQ